MNITARRSDFASKLYDKLARTQAGQDLFFSPFSLEVALAICAAGARGETRRALGDLIGAPASIDEQNRQYAELLKSVNGTGKRPFELATANALWGQRGSSVKSKFRKAVADFYGGAVKEVDFIGQPDEAVKTINGWVCDKTAQKIKELIRRVLIRSDTRLILTNAIYFKGQWELKFKNGSTREEEWHGPNPGRAVAMMHQKGDFLYYESNEFQALDLPYKGQQLSMLLVLPRTNDGLAALEARWSTDDAYRLVTKRLFDETVIVALPRFKIEAEFLLKPVLRELGADLAFEDKADFSGISSEPLKLFDVVHKAFVEVNEEGTEAAAATAAYAGYKCAVPAPKVFNADHPFRFFIRDRHTNAVLFSGRVVEPTR